jgi:hypothetical protein
MERPESPDTVSSEARRQACVLMASTNTAVDKVLGPSVRAEATGEGFPADPTDLLRAGWRRPWPGLPGLEDSVTLWLQEALERLSAWWRGDLRGVGAAGDTPPRQNPSKRLLPRGNDGIRGARGSQCPCGCGGRNPLEPLLRTGDPPGSVSADRLARPTLHPSVWQKTGGNAHFGLGTGRTVRAEPRPRRG